jgi:hypothetical protein
VTLNRSVADFEQLCDLIADMPVSKLCILQPVFYVHLDPHCIPAKSAPDATTNIELARWSFVGIIATCHLITGGSDAQEARQYFVSAWPNRVVPWLAFFHSQFIMRRANYRPIDGQLAISLVVNLLYCAMILGDLEITTLPSLYCPIAELWLIAIETRDRDVPCVDYMPPGHSMPHYLASSRTIMASLAAKCMCNQPFATTILEVAGGIGSLVSAALKYVKSVRPMTQDPVIISTSLHLLTETLSGSVEFIIRTSQYSAAIREEYILRKSVKEIFSAFRIIQPLLHATGSMDHMLAPLIHLLYQYFSASFRDADDAISVFYQALSSHALETVVCIGHCISLDHRAPIIRWVMDLLAILARYIMYDKILTYTLSHIDVLSSAIDPIARQNEALQRLWHNIERCTRMYGYLRLKGEMMRRPLSDAKGWLLRVSHRHRPVLIPH